MEVSPRIRLLRTIKTFRAQRVDICREWNLIYMVQCSPPEGDLVGLDVDLIDKAINHLTIPGTTNRPQVRLCNIICGDDHRIAVGDVYFMKINI